MPFTKESGCVVYRPPGYDKTKQYPCIVFIHGRDERGDGSDIGMNGLLGFLEFQWNNIKAGLEKHANFLLVAPQLSSSKWEWDAATVQKGYDYAINTLNANPKRIYMPGVSLGGGGVVRWLCVPGNSAKIAAATVICGVQGFTSTAQLANIKCPLWVLHEEDDPFVSVGNAHALVDGVNSFNPSVKSHKTIYPASSTMDHFIWGKAFDPYATPGIAGETVTMWQWYEMNELGSPVAVPIGSGGIVTPPPPPPPPSFTLKAVAEVTNITATTATLDGSKSEGKIKWQSWQMVSRPTGSNWDVFPGFKKDALVTNLQNLSAGNYTFKLDLSGEGGAVSTAMVSFTVGAAKAPVVAEADIPPGKTKVKWLADNTFDFT